MRSDSDSSKKQRVAAISILISGSLATVKFIVGISIGSLALISDAFHSLVDLGATVVTFFVVRVSDRPADEAHHYGLGKLESLSALGITALLYLVAGGVVIEAISRLREGAEAPTVSALAFIVLIVDIAVNGWRAHVLRKTAKETSSHALKADALHFASDMYGSFAVMAGLALSAYGFVWGDAGAAIAVAVIISILGFSLGRETVESLLDRAPEGATDRATAAIAALPGVVGVKQLRVRLVGRKHFVDAVVEVPRTWPIDRIDRIKTAAESAVRKALTEADLTFTAVPVARSNESVRDRIMVIARNRALAVHHVTVHDLGGRLTVSIDLEVDGGMPLGAAHDVTRGLEAAIREEFGADVEADTHIEPLEPETPPGSDAAPAVVDAVRAALTRLTADQGLMHDVHNVRVRDTETGQIVNYHCRAAGDLPVREVHDRVDEIERAIRKSFPVVKRVIGHAEPNID